MLGRISAVARLLRQRPARTTVVQKQYSRVPWMDRKPKSLPKAQGFALNPVRILTIFIAFDLLMLFSGCETPQQQRPLQSPHAAATEQFSEPPAPPVATPAQPRPEAPVPAAAPPKSKPAIRPEPAPARQASVSRPLTAQAKAAPPHFRPPMIANEDAPKPSVKAIVRPAQEEPSTYRVSSADVIRPQPVVKRQTHEVRPAGLAWFGSAL